MMNRVVHFEIPVNDTKKSSAFYSTVFGWNIMPFGNEDYMFCVTGDEKDPGINGGIMKRKDPGQPVTFTIQVDNLEDISKKITAAGGTIVVEKMAIPGVGWLSYFKDIEGTIVGIMQQDRGAK